MPRRWIRWLWVWRMDKKYLIYAVVGAVVYYGYTRLKAAGGSQTVTGGTRNVFNTLQQEKAEKPVLRADII